MENSYWLELVSCEYDQSVSNDEENSINVITSLNELNDTAIANERQYLMEQDQLESM